MTHHLHPLFGTPLAHEFTVDGWDYCTHEEKSDDNVKRGHFLVTPRHLTFEPNVLLQIDWNPYERMTPAAVRLWLALGCPKRFDGHPLNAERLMELAAKDKEDAA